MKKYFFLALVLIFIWLAARYNLFPFNKAEKQDQKSFVQIGNTRYEVEIADSDDERSQGLSDRDNLPEDHGMLFVFSTADTYSFWMHKMRFPLDFVWIKDEKIVDLTENVPVPLTETYAPTIRPKSLVDKVLEINAGDIKRHNIKIGDTVSLSLINPKNAP